MSYEHILLSVEGEGGVARLTLNRPDKLNSFTAAMHAEVRHGLANLADEASIRVLLITGAGRGFCAGQDLGDPALAAQPDLGETVTRDYAPLVLALRALPFPVVCAVNGVAAGAGANLALACDLVIAKQSATFIQSFARIGLMPDTGGTYFLPRLTGTARAMGLAMLGEKLTAEAAEACGLIWKCVPDDAFAAATEALLQQLAAAPTGALALIKQAVHASAANSLPQQLELERDGMRALGNSLDYQEGVAAFAARRQPVFHGR